MEIIRSEERLREVCDGGLGLILNDFAGDQRTKSSMEFNKLHRASCQECDPRRDRNAMTVKTSGQKIWFESFREAAGWLMENRPGNYTKCTRCNPA